MNFVYKKFAPFHEKGAIHQPRNAHYRNTQIGLTVMNMTQKKPLLFKGKSFVHKNFFFNFHIDWTKISRIIIIKIIFKVVINLEKKYKKITTIYILWIKSIMGTIQGKCQRKIQQCWKQRRQPSRSTIVCHPLCLYFQLLLLCK